MAILNISGTAVVQYTYDAWGNILSITGSMASTLGEANPLRYRGYIYDSETGLYYVSSRYYDPEIGRFINADSLVSTGQGILGNNMFAYCLNNPVNMLDSTGNWPEWIEEIGEDAEDILEEAKKRLAHTFYIMGRIATSPFKAIEASAGFGVGLGTDAEFNIGGVNVTAGASASITDSIVFENGSFDARSTSSAGFGINIAEKIDTYHEIGVQHSFSDAQCTCNVWSDPFAYRDDCPANRPISGTSKTIGFSFGLFLLVGVDVSVGINLDAWNQELYDIAKASFAYGG